ncbi:hypothetical protein B0H11DRAFT_1915892 [Mycena galericulata]|nr:hypothetical protein B0H11DRAFT_1932609 [Mycena galericulata]KAJ7480492.1 hypothetical protein B0H11DRAFT_1915892 [Mycena galericulata]
MPAKRYYTSESASNDKGFSLLFAHCIGSPMRHRRVREGWAFDWQNHGDAAMLNRELVASTQQMVPLRNLSAPWGTNPAENLFSCVLLDSGDTALALRVRGDPPRQISLWEVKELECSTLKGLRCSATQYYIRVLLGTKLECFSAKNRLYMSALSAQCTRWQRQNAVPDCFR